MTNLQMSANIEVVTRRDIINGVADRWKAQYKTREGWSQCTGGSKQIYDSLQGVDRGTASREEIDRIIGNETWTQNQCDLCEADVDETVAIEGRWQQRLSLCRTCLARVNEIAAARLTEEKRDG